MRFEIGAAGVEQNALADECNVGRGTATPTRAIAQMCNARSTLGVACGDREKGVRTQALERGLIQPTQRKSRSPRELTDAATVAARIEHIGRQRREPAREIVAAGTRTHVLQIQSWRTDEIDLLDASRFGLGAKGGQRERLRE